MVFNPSQQKILVVDDDPAIRHLVSRFLSFNQYQVEVAEDAKTARVLFERFQPDLVILDVNLPDDSGFNLCREMRKPQTMILMLTCLSGTDYVLEGFEQGADEYLTKPFNLEILKAKIGALFKRQVPLETPPPTLQKGLTFGRMIIDNERCEVTVAGQLIPWLTDKTWIANP